MAKKLQTIQSGNITNESDIKPQLKALTGLRFLAAAMIVALHAIPYFGLDHHGFLQGVGLAQGVTVFFVLSGFILTYTHSDINSFRRYLEFVSMRMSRIWPTHAVCTLICLVIFCGIFRETFVFGRFLCDMLMIHSLIPLKKYFFYLNFVSWSISTEYIFYLVFPALLFYSKRNLWVPVLFTAACACVGIALSCLFYKPNTPEGVWFGIVYINPLTRVFEFALGIAAARIFMRPELSIFKGKKADLFLELLSCFLAWFSICQIPTLVASQTWLPEPVQFYLQTSGNAPAFALLIFFLARGKGLLPALLSNKALVFLGEISFAIYMVHIIILQCFARWNLHSQGYPRIAFSAAYLVAVLVSATLLFFLIEKPARKQWKAFLSKQ